MAEPVNVPEEWKQLGIGIVGVGRIVQSAHLPAYRKHDLRVMGGYDVSPSALDEALSAGLPRGYRSLGELLDDPGVSVVDVATRPEGRAEVVHAALQAGKHVLAQKPSATSMEDGQSLVELADRMGCKLAVNVNGRWAPPWLGVTRLLAAGLLGRPFAVTHIYDVSYAWTRGTHFDEMDHFGLYDYSVHWVDIGLRWLQPALPLTVTAVDYRLESNQMTVTRPGASTYTSPCRIHRPSPLREHRRFANSNGEPPLHGPRHGGRGPRFGTAG